VPVMARREASIWRGGTRTLDRLRPVGAEVSAVRRAAPWMQSLVACGTWFDWVTSMSLPWGARPAASGRSAVLARVSCAIGVSQDSPLNTHTLSRRCRRVVLAVASPIESGAQRLQRHAHRGTLGCGRSRAARRPPHDRDALRRGAGRGLHPPASLGGGRATRRIEL